jgi:GT2 family glycosyltransferase
MNAPAGGSIQARGATLGPISAVVCNYNGIEHLPPCLSALLAQTRAIDEVIVVDNASTDGSRELAARDFPRAQMIALERNDGPCPARNAGLERARNEWVLLIDNDAVLEPDVLAKLELALLARGDAVLAQPRSVFAGDPTRVHYDGGECHYVGLFSLRNFFTPLADAQGRGVVEVGGAVSVALLVDRRALLAAGAFDPAFFILFEDLDLSLRLRSRGHVLLSVEDALVHHRGGTAGISYRGPIDYPKRRAFLHSRNRCLHVLKNYSWRTLVLCSPALAAYELVWALFTLGSGTFGAYCSGKLGVLRELGATLAKRRVVQAARVRRDRDLLVGGPLTIAPQLLRGGLAASAIRGLDGALALWWRLVRPLCG